MEENIQEKADTLFEFDVHMQMNVLYDYMLKHSYSGLQGILSTIIGFLLILFFLQERSILYLIFGIIVIVYIPCSLYMSAKRQMLTVEAFKNPLHYRMTDEGIEVSQGDVCEMQSWDAMGKVISTSTSIIIYTAAKSAAIFPRKDLGNHVVDVIEIISTHMDPKKMKIKQ